MKLFEKEMLKSELDEAREEIQYLRNENGKLREEVLYLRQTVKYKNDEVIDKNRKIKEGIEKLLKSLEERYQGYFMTLEGKKLEVEINTTFEKNYIDNGTTKVSRITIPSSEFVYIDK